jgi:hypothetical protein
MGVMALAPEVVVSIAVKQFLEARQALRSAGRGSFTLTHAFFALMGGFVLRVYIYEHEELQDRPDTGMIVVTKPTQACDESKTAATGKSHYRIASADDIAIAVEQGRRPRITIIGEEKLDLFQLCQ